MSDDSIGEPIPAVCFIDDLVRILRISRRSLERLRHHGVFPIREMPKLGTRRPRWSGKAVAAYLEGPHSASGGWRRAS